MTKTNYKAEYKRAKEQITELQDQILTLKDRLDVLRKAKNQTILKTEIINRDISEPVFGQNVHVPEIEEKLPERKISTNNIGINTEDVFLLSPPTPHRAETPEAPKRKQRKRVKENWSQCKIYTDSKCSQASFVQTCHCEGVESAEQTDESTPRLPKPPSPIVIPAEPTPAPELTTLSRMKTKEYISSDVHASEISSLESAFKLEREKQMNIHSREVGSLKLAIEKLSEALKKSAEENVKQTLTSPNGASVFHLYAEEKKRMEEQVRHINGENHKLRAKLNKVTQVILLFTKQRIYIYDLTSVI